MNRQSQSKKPDIEITVNIPGVNPKTKIGELTVEQFVQLLTQVSQQLAAARLKVSPEELKAILAKIRKIISKQGTVSDPKVLSAVESMQNALMDKMPDLLRETTESK